MLCILYLENFDLSKVYVQLQSIKDIYTGNLDEKDNYWLQRRKEGKTGKYNCLMSKNNGLITDSLCAGT